MLVLWVVISLLFALSLMAASLTIEQATVPQPPLPTPSLASEDGEDIDSDHRPILERENDDDGPPPIRSPRYRNRFSLLLPPAPPTSRGTSFDEPMCTQNARSQADLWLVGFWLEQRMDSEDAPIDTTTTHTLLTGTQCSSLSFTGMMITTPVPR